MTETKYSRPRRLDASDDVSDFDCGQQELNEWLSKYAYVNQNANMATVFVTQTANKIVGYYALATGGVAPEDAPSRVTKGVARHPIPVIILTRLAISTGEQGAGLGRALVRDCLVRVEAVSKEIGVRALLIHAKDPAAKEFYLKCAEFEPSPTDPMHLYLLMKDLRKAMER